VEQAAAAAESLEEQAQSLSDTVGRFTVEDGSGDPYSVSRVMSANIKSKTPVKVQAKMSAVASGDWEEF
jgi:methyl-accepting chemotaxis protein